MNGRRFCQIVLALVAGVAMVAGGPTLAAGRGGGRGGGGGGMHGGGMQGGGMQGGGFHGHGGFHHGGFHHGHGHAVFVVGGGWGWWGYPYYGWSYPDAYASYYAPSVQYIEQGDGTDGASANAWWYRCDQPSGYYPYVKECPGGWQTEPAQPSL